MNEPISSWLGEGDGLDAPDCPHCSKPLRAADAPREAMYDGIANLPWNSGWDGRCESCGHVFEVEFVTMGCYAINEEGYTVLGSSEHPPPPSGEWAMTPDQRPASERLLDRGPRRSVSVRPANSRLVTFFDEAIVLTGVEITTTTAGFHDREPTQASVHLTLNELRQIVDALNGPLKIVTQQWGWSVDDT